MKLRSGFVTQAVDARRTIGLTQEDAARLIGVGGSTLQKYELGEVRIHPDIVVSMSQVYHDPRLTAMYCENECPIGCMEKPCRHDATLERLMLDLLTTDEEELPRTVKTLHRVLADGVIDDDEKPDVDKCMAFLDELGARLKSLTLKVKTIAEKQV